MHKNRVHKSWGKILIHVLSWTIVFSLPYLLRYNYDDRMRNDPEGQVFLSVGLLTGIFWIISFYLNAETLIPKLVYRKKYAWYALCLTGIFFIILLIHGEIFKWLVISRPFSFPNSLIFNLPAYLLTIAASTAYKVLSDRISSDKYEQAKQEETLKTELSFLRSQISPHFVFNILNNITALARLKSDALEPTVMKLSSLLRYMLYETNEEKVSLQTEIEYLQSYIDLQQQRFGSKAVINITLETGNMALEIEPMLLIPFVENAFKHGISMIEEPQIDISLHIREKTLQFSVSNKYNTDAEEIKDKTSGIGLANVKRRLNLLYGKEHELTISRSGGWYKVFLQLNLR